MEFDAPGEATPAGRTSKIIASVESKDPQPEVVANLRRRVNANVRSYFMHSVYKLESKLQGDLWPNFDFGHLILSFFLSFHFPCKRNAEQSQCSRKNNAIILQYLAK